MGSHIWYPQRDECKGGGDIRIKSMVYYKISEQKKKWQIYNAQST